MAKSKSTTSAQSKDSTQSVATQLSWPQEDQSTVANLARRKKEKGQGMFKCVKLTRPEAIACSIIHQKPTTMVFNMLRRSSMLASWTVRR